MIIDLGGTVVDKDQVSYADPASSGPSDKQRLPLGNKGAEIFKLK